jgi:hypothetical protein
MLRYGAMEKITSKGIEHYERKFRRQRNKWLKLKRKPAPAAGSAFFQAQGVTILSA